MMTATLIAFSFLGLVVAPCAIGLRIRASIHTTPSGTNLKPGNPG